MISDYKNISMKRISVLTPTRGRPVKALDMAVSALTKAGDIDRIKLWFWLDEDDPEMDEYMNNLAYGPYAEWIQIMAGPQQPIGKCWNYMATHEFQRGDVLMMGNDDIIFQSENWDSVVLTMDEFFTDGIYVFYPHDSNDGKCTFPIVSSKWVDTLGYLYPEIFEFLAHDTYAQRVGQGLDRLIKLKGFVIDHRHFAFGKSYYDQTYRQHRDNGATKRDRKVLEESTELIDRDIAKLMKLKKKQNDKSEANSVNND